MEYSFKQFFQFVFLICIFVSCSEDDTEIPNRQQDNPLVTIDASTVYQTISGFGGANQMWGTTFPSSSDMQKAFGSGTDELGLSIFRIRISSNRDEWPLIVDVSKQAQNMGAIILASPWSPPAHLKSNNSDVGGYLLEENYEAYANYINEFVSFMEEEGVDIYAVSIQNEPDIQVSYESCDWTAVQMRNFLRDYGHLITGAKVVAPESFNFNRSFSDVLLNDETAATNFDIVGGHIYGGGEGTYPLAENMDKEIWMTEYLLNLNEGDWEAATEEEKWAESLQMLETIHNAMQNNWNAYIWWYLKRYYSFIGDSEQGTEDGSILKRGYAFSHFSAYIRPGFQRISIEEDESTNLLMTAYKDEGQTVAVFINKNNASATIELKLSNSQLSSGEMMITTAQTNRVTNQLPINDGETELVIPPHSVVTCLLE